MNSCERNLAAALYYAEAGIPVARSRIGAVSQRVAIWTDGAYSGNPGPGGGAVLRARGYFVRRLAGRGRGAHQGPHSSMDLRMTSLPATAAGLSC